MVSCMCAVCAKNDPSRLDLGLNAFQKTRMKSCLHGLRICLVLGSAVLLAACAASREKVEGWFGAATPTPAGTAAADGRVYYAAMDGLKVYSEPSSSSKVIARLSLHERVTRFKIERGYAYVENGAGQMGWVNNAQLLWRLPSVAPAAATEEPREAEEEEAREATATATEPSRTATPGPPKAQSEGTPGGVAPAIFDAY